MFFMHKHRVGLIAAAVCALSASQLAGAVEHEKVKTVISEQTRNEEAAKASQAKVTKLDDEASGMLAEYRQVLAEQQSLKSYNDQLAIQVKSQNEELASLQKQLDEVGQTAREALPMVTRMLATLEKFVSLDMPFLPEERAKRIAGLKEMMSRADVSLAEKYRRVVEAYQIEMEYGRTIEAYQGKVGEKTVDFLRAGRVALLYQTLDGNETGYWDAGARKWVAAPEYGDDIKAGLKIAKKQAAPDFLAVAVPAAKEIK